MAIGKKTVEWPTLYHRHHYFLSRCFQSLTTRDTVHTLFSSAYSDPFRFIGDLNFDAWKSPVWPWPLDICIVRYCWQVRLQTYQYLEQLILTREIHELLCSPLQMTVMNIIVIMHIGVSEYTLWLFMFILVFNCFVCGKVDCVWRQRNTIRQKNLYQIKSCRLYLKEMYLVE